MNRKRLLVPSYGASAIRILRAGFELNFETVTIYSHADKYALHRYKADEAYLLHGPNHLIYFDEERILALAKRENIHVIHPGFGFLAESPSFAKKVQENGITFIGETASFLSRVQNKPQCKEEISKLGIPVVASSPPFHSIEEGEKAFSKMACTPCVLKPVSGIHSTGITVIQNVGDIHSFFQKSATFQKDLFSLFTGKEGFFLEPYSPEARVIELPYLTDREGTSKVFPPRDISIHTHFQRTVTFSPPSLPKRVLLQLFQFSETILQHFKPTGAGSIEFLVLPDEAIFFLELTPRLLMNHVVTEEITGIDLVTTQIWIHEGRTLGELGILDRRMGSGTALQVRIATEDPTHQFQTQTGKITAYRQAGGFGIRVDEGNVSPGSLVEHPHDSTLLYVTAKGIHISDAANRLYRALSEFRIRGMKTNIPFLLNLLQLKDFQEGTLSQNYLHHFPILFDIKEGQDRGTKVLHLLAHLHVNGMEEFQKFPRSTYSERSLPSYPDFTQSPPQGSKQLFHKLGREGFCEWLRVTQPIQYTDTTLTDGQLVSLFGLLRSLDILQFIPYYAYYLPSLFSIEVLNSHLFFILLRYLKENPWKRIQLIRNHIPNVLLQVTLNASTIGAFHKLERKTVFQTLLSLAEAGIDLFRLYDPSNSIDSLKSAIQYLTTQTQCLVDGTIGYIKEIPDAESEELEYYLTLAHQLEESGIHILTIEDPLGKLNPPTAEMLINALKEVVKIPIRLHTHDSIGNQIASYLRTIEAGIDLLDVTLFPYPEPGANPSLHALASLLPPHHPRYHSISQNHLHVVTQALNEILSHYDGLRAKFPSASTHILQNGIPADAYRYFEWELHQYSHEKEEVHHRLVNLFQSTFRDQRHFPSFPLTVVLSDLALASAHSLPISSQYVLRSSTNDSLLPQALTSLPHLPKQMETQILFPKADWKLPNEEEMLFTMLPHDFFAWKQFLLHYGDPFPLPTPVFFGGMLEGEEYTISISKGKDLIIKYLYSSSPDEEGYREVFFEINGQVRSIRIPDHKRQGEMASNKTVSAPTQLGSPFSGIVTSIFVAPEDLVEKHQPLLMLREKGLQWILFSPYPGKIQQIHVRQNQQVLANQCLIEIIPHEAQ